MPSSIIASRTAGSSVAGPSVQTILVFLIVRYHPLHSYFFIALLYIFTYSFVFWIFFQKDIVNSEGEILMKSCAEYVNGHFVMTDIRISTMGVGFLIAMLFLSSIISQRTDLRDVFYLFTMSLFIGFAGQTLLFLRFCPANLSTGFEYNNSFITCLLIVYVLAGAMLLWRFITYFMAMITGFIALMFKRRVDKDENRIIH